MAFQPNEEQNEPHNTYEYTNLETSQYSQNSVPKIVKFSSITNIADDPSYNIEDINGIEKDQSNASDTEEKFDEFMQKIDSSFGDMSCDQRIACLAEELDKIELKHINQSITDRTMSVANQPPTDIRRRYESDGKRQIEKSRSKPMAIKLPNLKNCKLNPDQSLWLQLCQITIDKNPLKKVYIHPYKLEYHEDDLPKCDHGSVRIPLTEKDIKAGIKQLDRLSIIKIKLDAYTFEFIPYDSLSTNGTADIYENKNAKSIVAKAKLCRDIYNLQSSRIACKFLIKQNDTWLMTDIECETDVMEEKKKSNKRSASANTDDEDDDQVHRQSPAKKRKRSSSLIKSLPITRVKNS